MVICGVQRCWIRGRIALWAPLLPPPALRCRCAHRLRLSLSGQAVQETMKNDILIVYQVAEKRALLTPRPARPGWKPPPPPLPASAPCEQHAPGPAPCTRGGAPPASQRESRRCCSTTPRGRRCVEAGQVQGKGESKGEGKALRAGQLAVQSASPRCRVAHAWVDDPPSSATLFIPAISFSPAPLAAHALAASRPALAAQVGAAHVGAACAASSCCSCRASGHCRTACIALASWRAGGSSSERRRGRGGPAAPGGGARPNLSIAASSAAKPARSDASSLPLPLLPDLFGAAASNAVATRSTSPEYMMLSCRQVKKGTSSFWRHSSPPHTSAQGR